MGLIGKAVQWVFITPVLYSDGARSPLWYVTMAILARLTALVDLLILAVLALPLAAVFVNPGWGGYLYFRFCHAVYGGDIRKIGPRVPAVPGLDICADSGQDDESADEKKRRGGEGTETESPPLYPNTRRSLIPWSPVSRNSVNLLGLALVKSLEQVADCVLWCVEGVVTTTTMMMMMTNAVI